MYIQPNETILLYLESFYDTIIRIREFGLNFFNSLNRIAIIEEGFIKIGIEETVSSIELYNRKELT